MCVCVYTVCMYVCVSVIKEEFLIRRVFGLSEPTAAYSSAQGEIGWYGRSKGEGERERECFFIFFPSLRCPLKELDRERANVLYFTQMD